MFQIERDMRVVRGMESQQDPNTRVMLEKGVMGSGEYSAWHRWVHHHACCPLPALLRI